MTRTVVVSGETVEPPPSLKFGFAVLIAISMAGWFGVMLFTLQPDPWFRPWQFTWELGACFCLGSLARTLAFRVFKRVRIALDSAFYISVTFIWGAVPAAWLILLIITGDAALRSVGDHKGYGAKEREHRLWHSLAELTQAGSLPALVLLFLSALFRIDRGYPYSDLAIVGLLPLFSLSFLVVHYFLAGGQHWFQGARSRTLLRGFFLRVVVAELTLVPLSLAMVLDYLHHGVAFFLLLGCTALLFNWIFRRAVITSEKLDERVSELATLNNVGRILSSSLERRTLIANIASETVRLVGSASRFIIGAYDGRHENIVVDMFLRGDAMADRRTRDGSRIEPVQRAVVPRGFGLAGWVMQNRRPLLLIDVQSVCRDYVTDPAEIPKCASWLGVPLVIYDEVFGVMAVESDAPYAYTVEHLRVLTIIADHAAVALENARLYELATVDGLTGLYVRRYFDQRLNEEWRRGTRYGQEFALGILDLDHFKILNDTYGHQAGDQVLRAAAAVLRDNMRGADLAGRYGGEEFAFILPRTTIGEAKLMAERIRKDIAAMNVLVNGQRIQVTCSVGVAGYPECSTNDAAGLLAFADEALYDAKAAGRDQVIAAPHTELVQPKRIPFEDTGSRSEAITQEMPLARAKPH